MGASVGKEDSPLPLTMGKDAGQEMGLLASTLTEASRAGFESMGPMSSH